MADDKKYVRNQLVKKTVAELTTIWIDDEGLDITDLDGAPKPNKGTLLAALLDIDAVDEEELDDELEDEEEADVEDEEEEPLDDEEEDDLELPEEEEVEEDDIEEEAPALAKKTRSKAKKTDDGESGTIAAKQVATILGTEAKTLRQFFRSPASTIEAVGSGGRYEFNEADVPKIKEEFDAWKAGHGARGNKRAEGGTSTRKSRKAEAPVIEEVEELEIEDLEDEELELEDED